MNKSKGVSLPLLIGGIVLLLVVIGVAVLVFGGGGDDGADDGATAGIGSGDKGSTPARPRNNPKAPPVVSVGTIDEARRVGPFAVAQARGTARNPTRIRVRVSAAPKQFVTVNWQLGCFANRRTISSRGHYFTRTPDTRTLELPTSSAISCIVTATAQLTRRGNGRIKVSTIAG